jgi:hypothetical protein
MTLKISNYEELVKEVDRILSTGVTNFMVDPLRAININIMIGTKVITPSMDKLCNLTISTEVVFNDDGYNFTLLELAQNYNELSDTFDTLYEQSLMDYEITINGFNLKADVLCSLVNRIGIELDRVGEREYVMQLGL